MVFTPFPDGPVRVLSLCCLISIEQEGAGPLSTNLARERVTTLAQVCEDSKSDLFEEGPLKMNGILCLGLSYFPLMVMTSQYSMPTGSTMLITLSSLE